MSGVCGICVAPDRGTLSLASMLECLSKPGDKRPETAATEQTILGVVPYFDWQCAAKIPGIAAVADADLYGMDDLRNGLTSRGLEPEGMNAAELIAWHYQFRGEAAIDELRGAFAIGIWDEKRQILLLAIDHLGIKGLYWTKDRDRLLFGSRVKSVVQQMRQPPEIRRLSVAEYLVYSNIPAPNTIYENVFKLEAGTLLTYSGQNVNIRRYWDIRYLESENRDAKYWADQVRGSLRAAVRATLDGCDPARTGAFLSGGTDSSSVVAFMNEWHSPVPTFSIVFRDPRYSEGEYSRTTVDHFKTNHHELVLGPAQAAEAIEKVFDYYEEPFANSSVIGSYWCSVMGRQQGMDTLLAGDGGDEFFAGNERYAKDLRFQAYQRLPKWLRRGLIEPGVGLLPSNGGKLSLPKRYVRRANIPNPRRMMSYALFLDMKPEEIFVPEFLQQAPPESWTETAEGHFHRADAATELNRLLYLDVKITLADNDLRKVAGTAEMAGMRVRYPLLDKELAEMSGRIPSALKLKGSEKRYIFKKAMLGILPNKVLYKKKHGFGVPISRWFLEEPRLRDMMETSLSDQGLKHLGIFRPSFMSRLRELHRQEPGYYGESIWYLVVLDTWLQRHATGKLMSHV